MPTAEKVKCRCSLPMVQTQGGGWYCENCDVPQPWEAFGKARRVTRNDVRFSAYWSEQELQYKDNTKPEADPPAEENKG